MTGFLLAFQIMGLAFSSVMFFRSDCKTHLGYCVAWLVACIMWSILVGLTGVGVMVTSARADTPMTCQEQVSYLKDVVKQLGTIAEAYRLQVEATAAPAVVPRMKPKVVRERISAGPCGAYRQKWRTLKDGHRKYRCVG